MGLPNGFEFTGVACGIKASGKLDLAVISSKTPCVAVGVYTQNVVRAASIEWDQQLTPTNHFKALIINSGNANACTGQQGMDDNQAIAAVASQYLKTEENQVLVLSTGVIGQHLPMPEIVQGIEQAISEQGSSQDHFERTSLAILTTDKGPIRGDPNCRNCQRGGNDRTENGDHARHHPVRCENQLKQGSANFKPRR